MSNFIHKMNIVVLRVWWCILLSLSLFLWNKANSDSATPNFTQNNYSAKFYEQVRNGGGIEWNNINRKWLILVFCKTLLNSDLAIWFYDVDANWSPLDYDKFSPKRSLFVFLLCNTLWADFANSTTPKNSKAISSQYDAEIKLLESALSKTTDDDKKKRIQWELDLTRAEYEEEKTYPGSTTQWSDYAGTKWVFLKSNRMDQINSSKTTCLWSTNLNNCPLSTYISSIFHQIINDYTNSKIANIYGSMTALGNTTEIQESQLYSGIQNFSDYYYSKCWTIEWESKELYINKDQIDWWDKDYCSHPNTYKVLSNFIENSYSKTKKNVIVDYDLLLNDVSKWLYLRNALITDCKNNSSLDCSLDSYRHLVLNELMFYGMFMKFYSHFVVSSEQFGPLSIGKDKVTTQEILDEEGRKSQVELEVATNAIQQDFKIIRNLYAKFPIHIGLVAYLEDLVNFRNTLVKLYTPIHQMYYKLRNAQTYER